MASRQQWQVAADGGYLANPELSRQIRYAAQPMTKFGQFVRQEPGFGKNQHDTLDFNKISNVQTAANTQGLSESNVMPETKYVIRRGQLIVTEYGNSVPYTGKLEALAEFDPSNIAQRALMQDQAKTLDAVRASYFKNSGVAYIPTGSVGTPTNTIRAGTAILAGDLATRNMQMFDVKEIRDYMMEQLLTPPYDGENYVCVGSTRALRGVKNDTEFIEAAKYGDPERLFTGEVGKIEGVRFIESNHQAAIGRLGAVGSSEYDYGEAVFFGEDPVVEGVAIAPEVRAKIPGDYGRSRGVAWYAILGWATPFQFAVDAEARTVWFTSYSNPLGPPV